ncbi:MAG: carbon storage regulator [Rubripirellula sp.]
MLVLTRKADEQILIGDDIKITLVRVRGNSVRVGIEAPREIRVVRGELEKRDSEPSDELEPVEREEVFAHPESQIRRRAQRQPTNRLTNVTAKSEETNAPERQIFVGRIRGDEKPQLERAPLARFVSAT